MRGFWDFLTEGGPLAILFFATGRIIIEKDLLEGLVFLIVASIIYGIIFAIILNHDWKKFRFS